LGYHTKLLMGFLWLVNRLQKLKFDSDFIIPNLHSIAFQKEQMLRKKLKYTKLVKSMCNKYVSNEKSKLGHNMLLVLKWKLGGWFMPAILATQKAEIGKITVGGQLGHKVCKTSSQQ
jgi:hypothetical protein